MIHRYSTIKIFHWYELSSHHNQFRIINRTLSHSRLEYKCIQYRLTITDWTGSPDTILSDYISIDSFVRTAADPQTHQCRDTLTIDTPLIIVRTPVAQSANRTTHWGDMLASPGGGDISPRAHRQLTPSLSRGEWDTFVQCDTFVFAINENTSCCPSPG